MSVVCEYSVCFAIYEYSHLSWCSRYPGPWKIKSDHFCNKMFKKYITYSPDWFVRNDNSVPVNNLSEDSLELSQVNLLCFASFSFLQLFTDTIYDVQSILNCMNCLFCNERVVFSKNMTAFRMSKYNPKCKVCCEKLEFYNLYTQCSPRSFNIAGLNSPVNAPFGTL